MVKAFELKMKRFEKAKTLPNGTLFYPHHLFDVALNDGYVEVVMLVAGTIGGIEDLNDRRNNLF